MAVKKLIINDISVDSTTVYNEFRREVYLMRYYFRIIRKIIEIFFSKLKHPNIVNLMAFSVNPFAMVMEIIKEAIKNFYKFYS